MKKSLIYDAPSIWKLLNGIVCICKPAGESFSLVRKIFLRKLCEELNELDCRIPKQYTSVERDETTNLLAVKKFINLADHPLVMGPMYEASDFKCSSAVMLGRHTAGVLVFGLNGGTKEVYRLHKKHPLRVYHVKATFGYMTNNLYTTGKVVDKSSFNHIKKGAFERLLTTIEASHQRSMYDLCGVDIQSQAAYEIAAKGLIRPQSSEIPVIYGVKCVNFDLPNFTIEVHCINEYEDYLKALVHNIGTRLQSYATCTGLQCVRHSYFSLEHSLLKKHWTLENVIANMQSNQQLIEKGGKLHSGLLNVHASQVCKSYNKQIIDSNL